MKLPAKAQTAAKKRAQGMKMAVASNTGLTAMRRRKTCAYEPSALESVRTVSRGTVCLRVEYGKGPS